MPPKLKKRPTFMPAVAVVALLCAIVGLLSALRLAGALDWQWRWILSPVWLLASFTLPGVLGAYVALGLRAAWRWARAAWKRAMIDWKAAAEAYGAPDDVPD